MPSVTKYIPVTSGSASQPKRKEYVPITLRTFTLLGFAVICLGIIALLEVLVRTSIAKPYGGFIKRDATEWPGQDSDTVYKPYLHVIYPKQKQQFERIIAGCAESLSTSSSSAGTELPLSSTLVLPQDTTPQSKVTTLEKAQTNIVADQAKAPSIRAIPSHSKADEEDPTYYFTVAPDKYASAVVLHPDTSPTITTEETAAPEKSPASTTLFYRPMDQFASKADYHPKVIASIDSIAASQRKRPSDTLGPSGVDKTASTTLFYYRPMDLFASYVDLHPEVIESIDIIAASQRKHPTDTLVPSRVDKTAITTKFYRPMDQFATNVDYRPEVTGSIDSIAASQRKNPTDTFAPSRMDETTSTTFFSRPMDQFATKVDYHPEVTGSIDIIAASQQMHPGHGRIDHSRSGSGDRQSGPSDHTSDSTVTLVEVDDKFIKTHQGPILTVHITNSNGVSTTLHLMESPIDATPTPEVTLVAVNEEYAETYGGSIRTIRTTKADGAQTTLLITGSTIDTSHDEPVITRSTGNDHLGEAYEATGRLVTVHTTNAEGSSTTFLILAIPTTIVSEHRPTDESFAENSATQSQKSSSIIPKFGFEGFYFSGKYLPTLVAVLLSVFWKIIDTDIKRIEPFYLLSHASGTSAKALNENLLFKNAIVVPFQAAWRRQWIVCLSALIYCPLLSFAHLLAVTSFSLSTVKKCDPFADKRNCGNPFLAMQPTAVRILQGVLGSVVLGVIAIVLLQRRRKSPLSSEPWSLAGLATLLTDWGAIQNAFANIEVADSEADLKRRLVGKGHRFRLAYSMDGEQQQHLGIELMKNPYETDVPDTLNDTSHIYRPRLRSTRPGVLKDVSLIAFILFLCGVLTIVMVYQTTSDSLIEHFMSGQSLSVSLLFIIFGVVIRAGWEPIERGAYLRPCMLSANNHAEVHFLEIFHTLTHRHQRVTTLLRDDPRSFPLVTEVSSLIRGNFFLALIGTVGLLIEVLIVTLTGVPYSGTQIWKDAQICMRLSSAIISITIITTIVILLRRKRVERRLPRVPYTLATVIGYIYAARMLDSFVGLSTLDSRTRNRHMMEIGRGKEYGFGWTVGSDGIKRVGVDEEELQGDYKR
ncbi:hypothetical protein BDD12DRAFT_929759 [Trichophaea hybrida]|nr:hypothetical protein BDD12DRAFT_929759 [Trichophaea hybrida]